STGVIRAHLDFFFQAEDGIRDRTVTGVQTCALPFLVGRTLTPGEAVPHGRQEVVGGDYFRAMKIPLVEGRTFADSDTADARPVCIIDDYLVRKYFADRSPLGQEI